MILYKSYNITVIPAEIIGPTGTPSNIINPITAPKTIGITIVGLDVNKLYPFDVNNIISTPDIIAQIPKGDFSDSTKSFREYWPEAKGLRIPIVNTIIPTFKPYLSSLVNKLFRFKSLSMSKIDTAIIKELFLEITPKPKIASNII